MSEIILTRVLIVANIDLFISYEDIIFNFFHSDNSIVDN